MKKKILLFAALFSALPLSSAWATPSTTYWAPSTATCQAFAVPHVTYDTYFAKGGGYPVDSGLTMGFLPGDKLQAEVGADLLLPVSAPTTDPFLFNGKLCLTESSMFKGSPALSIGIYNVGTQTDVTNYNVLHLMAQKSMPFGGYTAVGLYHGLNEKLFTNSDGQLVRTGVMAAVASPDVQIGFAGLKKVNFVADIQTGKNALGAWGGGANLYFADNVSLLTGPVFFLDKALQPGGQDFMWTLQLDVDVVLRK